MVLAIVLPRARKLRTLRLCGNPLGPKGGAAIMRLLADHGEADLKVRRKCDGPRATVGV
jgi:hypothetical protein